MSELARLQTRFETYLLTEKRVAENTFGAYKRDLEQFVAFTNRKKVSLKELDSAHIKSFLLHLKRLRMSSRSMARKISTLKSFFTYLSHYGGWKNNLSSELITPKIEQKLPHFFTELEIEQLFRIAEMDKTAAGTRNRVMLYLLYISGMRISELCNLRMSDVHFDTGFIHVSGKGGKSRMVPLPQMMLEMLHDYSDTIYKEVNKKGKIRADSEYLFPVFYAGVVKPITRQSFWIILKKMWARSGSDKAISPHKLRHSLATHMLKSGADLRSLQVLLGHENLATVQIYTHVETSYLRSVYNKKHPRS
jgi:site-specific recombinase XerD